MSLGFLSRYRKRKQLSLDGTVAGVEYNRYHRGYNRSTFDARPGTGMSGMVRAYDPDPGRPEFPESDYRPYEWEMPPKPTPPLRLDPPEMTGPAEPPDYDSCLMTDELTVQMTHDANEEPQIQEPLPFDHDVGAQGTPNRTTSLDDLVEALAPVDPIQEMEQAIDQLQQMPAPIAFEPEQAEPTPDPFEMQRQMYEQQLQMLMDPFMTGPGM